MSFPWAIHTNRRTYRKRDRARTALARLRRRSLRLFVLLAVSSAYPVVQSPVARAEPAPGTLPGQGTITTGAGSFDRTANTLTINQDTQKISINWPSFNIGRDASVTFRQPDASSVALNRIFQGSASEIFGRLSANGQVYLLNQNGFIFGPGAVVDTHSLIASTLNMSDKVFNEIGLTEAINQGNGMAAFEHDATAGAMGLVKIEAGAMFQSAEGGRIMIFAPQIENAGEINTPGGQAVLAASHDKVYLAASDDPNLRGLLVEVDTGGSVSNLGKIVAERGNVSLIGYAVNQDGLARATTAVNLNGSIRLLARDKAVVVGEAGNLQLRASRTGELTLGQGSLTEVAPDNTAATAADAQDQPASRIELMGHRITLESGARIVAPAGDVNIAATKNPQTPGPTNEPFTDNDSLFEMKSGSLIDVSGLASAVLPMERNVVAVELRGNELRDVPLQRSGLLYGETVYVDVREGTPLADISGQLAAIERPLNERLATGGTVTINSEGAVKTEAGATIDVSGGAVRYEDGFISTSKLVSQGKLYDIGEADPNRVYTGIFGTHTVEHRKWNVTRSYSTFGTLGTTRFEPGYIEGKDAGTVAINARQLDLQGTLRGETTAGRYQRLPPGTDLTGFMRQYHEAPLGGALTLGAADYSGLQDFTLGSLADLGADGMNRLRVYARGKITVAEDTHLALAPGGELKLEAGEAVELRGDITAAGGSVQLVADNRGGSVQVGGDARIDVSGQWVNDSVALNPGATPEGPVFIDGGDVSVMASDGVTLERGSVIAADGGAQLQRDGKLKAGSGGDIVISSKLDNPTSPMDAPALRLDGELHAYALYNGGSLSLTGGGFQIGGAPAATPAGALYLAPEFFQRGGFSRYNLTATHSGIVQAEGSTVTLSAQNLELQSGYRNRATGAAIGELTRLARLPDYLRQPVSLSLALERSAHVAGTARVEIGRDAVIQAEPGATVALKSDTQLIVDGTIAAPAGDIRLTLTKPESENETVFDATQAIWLGSNARLLAGAHYQAQPDDDGLRHGTMHDAGSVTIAAERGYLIAGEGSRIDVSGTTQTVDVIQNSRILPVAVSGDAGRIDLLAAEGMVLNGELRGAAARGAGAAGGTLSINLDASGRGGDSNRFPLYPTDPREIVLSSANVNTPAPGTAVSDELNGTARLDPAKVAAGGFDELALRVRTPNNDQTQAAIRLEGNIDLAVARRLTLDAPVLISDGGDARLAAAHVQLGTPKAFYDTPVEPQGGDGSLRVQAQHVDLIGTLALRGFSPDATMNGAPVRIESTGDIRLIGGEEVSSDNTALIGRLNSAADVELRADQVYAATATDFTLSVPDGRITILPGDATAAAPLSAASRITLNAADIEQHGTLRAPFGEIALNAGNSLTLGEGSITSVSGAGQLVPFGLTEAGTDWLYPLTDGTQKQFEASPEKNISLTAPQIALAPGSTLDVSGGGDLLAREFLPGPGGSRDILEAANAEGAFAIVPAQSNPFGSYDPFLSRGAPVGTGDTIHIAPGGPLPAGEYAMLPAGYALLPGAYLVTPQAKTAAPVPGQALTQPDGSSIVAGQRGIAGTGTRDSLWSAFQIENGAQVRNRAEYLESRADNFFADGGARLNRDAGRLVLDAGTALTLGGTLAQNTGGGRGSEVDIVGERLAVVDSYSGGNGRVELLDAGLNALNADSLLLGASRSEQDGEVMLTVRAKQVTVETGAELVAPEVLLTAKEQLTVADGASITAADDGAEVGAVTSLKLDGDSALARVSSGEQVRVTRTADGNTGATLDIAAGAILDAARSITLDAAGATTVDGELRTHGGALGLGAARVSLGETQGVSDGLVLSNERLARLDARELTLNSRSTIDLYGQVSLNGLDHVALDAGGLAGYHNAGQGVAIGADTIALSNRSGAGFSGTPDGSGTLNLAAREVTLGEGEFAVRGFDGTTITATQQIIAKPETDTKTQLHVAGDLTMQTARLTADSGADVHIDTQDATGAIAGAIAIALAAPAGGEPLVAVSELGAKLEISANAIEHATQIELPSGMVTLNATGAGGVNIADNASINVAGLDLTFADLTVGSPGGTVSLIADTGDVIVGAARIDVSGAASGGDAGTLSVSAPNGMVQFDAKLQLAATAREGNRAGSFALDARTLANSFSAVNAALNTAGFTDERHLRLRSGDIEIAAGDTLLAHDLQVAADAGRIDVRGKLNASGEQAGRVALYARDEVSLHAGSVIDAHATGADEEGGHVTLGSTSGRLDLQAGATMDVAGTDESGARADSGTVHLRAEREGTDGVAINPIATNITGAERVDIEAYKTYSASSIDAGLIATIQGETTAFMANAVTIENALGADARFHLLPGAEIRSTGNLSLNTDWDLFGSGWRYDGEAGVLTLRAAGDLNINRTLSDGVAPGSDVGGLLDLRDTVQTGASWSYRLAGGADLAGANPLSVANGAGDVNLAAGVKVRTGTGDIEIAAGRDLRLADSSAAIYTVGENRGTGVLPETDGFPAEVTKELFLKADFLHNGGMVHVIAGRDIIGAVSDQFVNDWLSRIGGPAITPSGETVNLPTAWAVNIAEFRQNIGALGGGEVRLTAGNNIDNLSVAIPTTGQPVAESGAAPDIAGGGDMRIEAGGDVRGGVFYLGKGRARITAGGSVTRPDDKLVYPILALGDGQYHIKARKDLTIESAVNPTVLATNPSQARTEYVSTPASYFFTYTDDSAVRLEAIAGDARLSGNISAMTASAGILERSNSNALSYFPGTLGVRSLQGDVVVNSTNTVTLMPVPRGDMEILAGDSLRTTGTVSLFMSDADPSWLPGILKPVEGLDETAKRLNYERTVEGDGKRGPEVHAATPVHLGDTRPVRIVANAGNIGPEKSGDRLTLQLSKPVRLSAGGDVRNLTLQVQHANAGDISAVEAGGSILFPTERDPGGKVLAKNSKFEIAGPGELHVIAGQDVNLGSADGIISIGDQNNPALADDGASITVMAGLDPAPDYAGFIERYLVADDAYHERLARYMTGLGAGATGVDAFKALPAAQQRRFILEVFFSELRESGVAAVESKDYTRGFDAIKSLFPAEEYDGDVKSFLSRIYTLDGGDISLIVPGGLVNAGVASASGIDKDAGKLGIVAQRAGAINAFVRDDFLVNASRVFALDGGDILIWSSAGNIDAGKGAKTALYIPPPTTTYDADGNAVVEFPPSISGSGIRGAVSTPGRAPGDTYLIAPLGVINAGDAGIGTAGNLTIAATAVIGADNIQVGGIAAGVPTDTGGLGAGLAGVGDIAATASKMAEDATRGLAEQRESEQGYLSVEVTGFGGGEDGGDVINLRNRREPGAP